MYVAIQEDSNTVFAIRHLVKQDDGPADYRPAGDLGQCYFESQGT